MFKNQYKQEEYLRKVTILIGELEKKLIEREDILRIVQIGRAHV